MDLRILQYSIKTYIVTIGVVMNYSIDMGYHRYAIACHLRKKELSLINDTYSEVVAHNVLILILGDSY